VYGAVVRGNEEEMANWQRPMTMEWRAAHAMDSSLVLPLVIGHWSLVILSWSQSPNAFSPTPAAGRR
jgi:hypothetical protein